MKMLSYNLCQVIIGDFQVGPFLSLLSLWLSEMKYDHYTSGIKAFLWLFAHYPFIKCQAPWHMQWPSWSVPVLHGPFVWAWMLLSSHMQFLSILWTWQVLSQPCVFALPLLSAFSISFSQNQIWASPYCFTFRKFRLVCSNSVYGLLGRSAQSHVHTGLPK